MSDDVFVSHSHQDLPAAEMIVQALEERGVTCWIAPRDIPPGGSYAEAILNAIESASCFVLIYSEHSNVSSHVLREVERALKFGANIVPVRFDNSAPSKSLDYLLATVHWLSVTPDSRDRSIIKAAEQIASLVARFDISPANEKLDRVLSSQTPIVPVASPPKRTFLWIGAAILLALSAGALGFFLSRTPPQTQSIPREAAVSPTAAPVATTPAPTLPSLVQSTPESTPPPQTKVQPSPSHQAVHGIVQDPDGITNVRDQPNIHARIIAVVKDGERVEIDQMQGDWLHIILGPAKGGFVHKSRVKINPAN